ncbi:MAG: adenosylcobinamide-phosphate synthase CbiB [Synergistaceae bacterium]|jgi:adenosylcobinamide-phosphate synthase|nr:adenosylcobinamide-phosphate synthase CbiB [Synergistaceae bacterium]
MYILAALFLDALLGDPKRLPHPVGGVGVIVRFWEKRLYPNPNKKQGGVLLCLAVLGTTAAVVGLLLLCASSWFYELITLYLLYAALAWRSLKDQSLLVAQALWAGNADAARTALSHIVGRDTKELDQAAMVRASIETVGENFIDGVFSVLFFMTLGYMYGGTVGAVLAAWLFKAANTLDSMVGYNDERYRDFGRAAARLDDALNFIPARLGGVVTLLAGACLGYPFLRGFWVFLRDRKKHKSPNSAHGESAFAGLLGVRLGGGASYGGVFEERPSIGCDDFQEPEPFDILRAHALLDAAVGLSMLLVIFFLS